MSLLFRNRWIALLWLAMTVASASFFVGNHGAAEKLLDSAKQIRTQRQQLEAIPPSAPHVIEADVGNASLPMLLPAGDLNADPHDPQPGDVFIEAISGKRVRIVGREASAEPVAADPQ